MVDNGLVYLKEVAKYFMDFLETDFHKRKNPRRTIKLRNDENLMLGIKLEKYPKLNDVIRKSIRDSFNSKSLKQIAKGNYTSPIYSNLLDLINHQLKRLDGNVTDELAERIASIIEKSSILYKAEFNQALNTALIDASIAIKEVLVSPFIVNISKSLKDAALGDEGSIFLMEEELVSILLKDIESQITEAIKQIIAGEDINVAAEFQKTIVVDEIRSAISSFFANYQATDVFNEVFEISRNKSILEAQEIYLYFCDITLNSAKYPIFYIPVDFVRQGEVFNVEFDTRVYVNKKAIEFIGQEYRLKTNKVGELTSIKERILYLANFEGDFVQRISEILSELVGFFELNTNIDIADNAMQTAKSQHVQISNACYIALFDKSDEAVVNDYEEILKLLNEKDSELATAFQKIIEDFIHNEPESFIANVEEDWDEFKSWDKLVAESPIPLNEEQRQILMAIKKPKCKYITVEGPPGTGKSHTITAIVCDSVLNNKSVLVLSDKKEALDVVEDKISDALNKVRFDKDFQNPILRLGKTGSTYAQILSTASINRIKTHYRAVKNDSEKLYSGIEKTICSLKEDLETEFLINDEIDLDDIYHCIQLEKEYENNPPPIDLNEFSSIRDSFIELEEFRNIFERINQLIGPNGLADESKFFSTFKVSGSERFRIDILLKIISVSKDIINTSSSIKERFPDMSVLANCEQLSDASYMRLQEFLNSYNSLNSRIFGYLFNGGKVKELNEKFLKDLPLIHIETPHKNTVKLQNLISIFTYAKAKHSVLADVEYDFINVICNVLKQGRLFEMLMEFIEIEDDVKYIVERMAKYPNSMKLLGVDESNIISGKLVAMAADDFTRLIHYLTIKQKIEKTFSEVPEIDFVAAKKKIEKLITIQMTYQMDKRIIEFADSNKATATTLRKIIQKKQKFPRDEFVKLKEAFPCILAGIRDYAEYIPLQPDTFDLLIIDEASQVSIAQAFPALLRAKKVLILGDKKQFSNVKASQARSDMNREYLNNLRLSFINNISDAPPKLVRQENFNIKISILEFFEYISNYTMQLNKYFRGYKEIISFSNRFFYRNTLQVMKIRGKSVDDVIKFNFIEHDGRIEPIPKTNSLECEYILSELKRLKESGDKSSVGVITPHTNQQKMILEAVNKLADKDYYFEESKLKIMTFDTCQGEERDIIYYSMVATSDNDRLWGVFIKDLDAIDVEENGKIKAQRLNVGFSRAKEQMHFVVSKPLESFTGSIGLALRHYWNELEEGRKEPLPDSVDPNSPMEREVLHWTLQTNFWQQNKKTNSVCLVPQFNVGEYLRQLDPLKAYQHPKYKVDFLLVYHDEKRREHKIIIEYDGFKEHFTDYDVVNEYNYSQYYSPEDVYRQKTLESYGYKFIRINKFNSGKNPVETLNNRLVLATAEQNENISVLHSIHTTIDNIQNNGAKECPKCKEIRDNEDFADSSCTSGYGRICKCCKNVKKNGTEKQSESKYAGVKKCPSCKSKMVLRNGRYGKFYGCSKYPRCTATLPYR